jgi:molybdopterin/thiamine biosynthesis adenylyltransferase
MSNINMRSEGLVSNLHEYTFHILGCGAIGSSAATQLIRTGATKFLLYDMDKVATENIGVSQYMDEHIGMEKVEALNEHLLAINAKVDIMMYPEYFSMFRYQDNNDIVVLGFDNMKSRKEAVEDICYDKKSKPFMLIDGRMGGEHYQQYVFKDITLSKYMKTWYSDAEGDPEPCNIKATSYCSNMAGAMIVNAIRKVVTNSPYETMLTFNFPTMTIQKNTCYPA